MENRGETKNVIWNLRRNDFRSLWRGYGFVIDLNPWEVAVPQSWKLTQPVKTSEYCVSLARSFVATAEDPEGRAIIAGVFRESIKKHFKENPAPELGHLWQDFDAFCQYPGNDWQQEYLMCRRFSVNVKQWLASGLFSRPLSQQHQLTARLSSNITRTATFTSWRKCSRRSAIPD